MGVTVALAAQSAPGDRPNRNAPSYRPRRNPPSSEPRRIAPPNAPKGNQQEETPWWQEKSKTFVDRLTQEQSTDFIDRLRTQMTAEEAAFEQEIEDIVIAGKRALLRLRMQRNVEMPGYKSHLFKKIKRQIARALAMKRQREIARGITQEQSRRMKRRRKLELRMKYEEVYGREHSHPKSRKWLRRMERIV